MSRIKILKLVAKITLSGGALYYVFSRVSISEIVDQLAYANLGLLLAALVIYTASQVVAAFRLKKLFNLVPVNISHSQNMKLYWLGLFYNLFLPGGVGGDGFKVFLVGKYLKTELKKVIGAILSDRVSGLSVILILLLLLAPFIDHADQFKNLPWLLIPIVALGFFLFLRIFNRRLLPAFWAVLALAFVVQLLQMVSAIAILSSLEVDLSKLYDDYLFLFFLSAIAGSVPITLGGIGAREVVFLWGATYLGVDQNSAVALSLLFYVASALTALPGVVFTFKPAKLLQPTESSMS